MEELGMQIDSNDNKIYYNLKEAELEMENDTTRYTIDEVENSMNNIIKNNDINF